MKFHPVRFLSRALLLCIAASAFDAAAHPASAQNTEQRRGSFAGASLGLGIFGGDSDASELLDVAPVFGLSFVHRFIRSAHTGFRIDGTLSPMSNSGARDGLDARTYLYSLTAGPVFGVEVAPFLPYVEPMIGCAATVSHGTTISPSAVSAPHEVNKVTFALAYGFAAGSHVLLGEGARPWMLDLGVRLVDLSTLTFVRPDTDTFERDSSILEFRFGLMLGL